MQEISTTILITISITDMDTSTINTAITAAIKANGNNEITGPVLQSILLQIVSALNAGKEDTLTSGTNIKTLNSESLLGAGDIKTAERPEDIYVTMLSGMDFTGEALSYVKGAFTGAGGATLPDSVIEGLFNGKYSVLRIHDEDTSNIHIVSLMWAIDDPTGDYCEAYYKLADTYQLYFRKDITAEEYSFEYQSL